MSVHHGHIARLKPFYTARYQMDDPLHLCRRELLPATKRDDHGGSRFLLLTREQSSLRHGQMDAGPFHFRHLSDGSRQFPLQRPTIIQLLNKFGHPD